MHNLTYVARRLRTNTTKIRELCERLHIPIVEIEAFNYIDIRGVEKLEEELERNKESILSNDDLRVRIEKAKSLKKCVCGDDIEMSYARFSENSDIYIFRSGDTWVCNSCKLRERYNGEFLNLISLRRHINEHIEAGHKVPYLCTERIDIEIEKGIDIWGNKIEESLIGRN